MSNFVVSARKYRPIRFDEVVGQEHVSQTLKNAFKNNHLAHAFLFCGPRGVGKTTSARILAKVLNCQNITEDFEPCNECNSCVSFNNNASFNITELDAASNNSVEHIRALIEQVRFQPQQGKYKIFIIDEVHMLSQQAFNAFLKTLEEPPPYAKFILATTEKHKIIPTILSRCQIFDFNRIQIPATVAHLQGICDQEGIKAEKDALHIIAQKADGALRDALSIFDRIVSFANDHITYDAVIENLNVLDYDYYFKILDNILSENITDIMLLFDKILRQGFDSDVFINGLAEHFRNILVCKNPATISLLEVGDALKERYQEQAKIAPLSVLLTALSLANDCDINYKMARNKRLHVEMALIKMAFMNKAVAPSEQATLVTEKKTPEYKITKSEQPDNQQNTPEEVPQSSEQPSSEPVSTPKKSSLISSSLKLTSLSNLEKELDEETVEIKTDKPLQLETVQQAWKEYSAGIQSTFAKEFYRTSEVSLAGQNLKVKTASKMAKDEIQKDVKLMNFLRTKLENNEFALEVEVDMEKVALIQQSKPKKPLTPREIYKAMRKENPLIDEIQQKFGLYPE